MITKDNAISIKECNITLPTMKKVLLHKYVTELNLKNIKFVTNQLHKIKHNASLILPNQLN